MDGAPDDADPLAEAVRRRSQMTLHDMSSMEPPTLSSNCADTLPDGKLSNGAQSSRAPSVGGPVASSEFDDHGLGPRAGHLPGSAPSSVRRLRGGARPGLSSRARGALYSMDRDIVAPRIVAATRSQLSIVAHDRLLSDPSAGSPPVSAVGGRAGLEVAIGGGHRHFSSSWTSFLRTCAVHSLRKPVRFGRLKALLLDVLGTVASLPAPVGFSLRDNSTLSLNAPPPVRGSVYQADVAADPLLLGQTHVGSVSSAMHLPRNGFTAKAHLTRSMPSGGSASSILPTRRLGIRSAAADSMRQHLVAMDPIMSKPSDFSPRRALGTSSDFDLSPTSGTSDGSGLLGHGASTAFPHLSLVLPARILIVEDDPVSSKVALRFLQRMGYDPGMCLSTCLVVKGGICAHTLVPLLSAVAVFDGKQAIDMIVRQGSSFDVIFMVSRHAYLHAMCHSG